MISTRNTRPAAPLSLGLCLFAIALSSPGCDQRTSERRAFDKASGDIRTTSVSGHDTLVTAQKLQKSAGELQPVISGGTGGEKASASLLAAQASKQQAEVEAAKASQAERVIRENLSMMTNASSIWSLKSAIAQGAENFDPTPQINKLEESVRERTTQIADETAKHAALKAQLDDLKSRAKAELDGAGALMQQAAKITQQISASQASQGVALAEESRSIRRQADAKRLAGEQLLAEAAQIEPVVNEHAARVTQYENQRKKIQESQQSLRARGLSAQAEAKDARAAAKASSDQIGTLVSGTMQLLNEGYKPALESAVSAFTKAAGNAKQASLDKPSGDPVSSGRLATGDIQLSMAQLHLTRTQTFTSVAGTLDVLAASTPALPGKAQFVADAKTLREDAVKSKEETKSALEAAQAAFAGVSSKGETKDRLEKLATQLEIMAAGGQAPAPADDAVSAGKDDAAPVAAPDAPNTAAAPGANADIDPGAIALIQASLDATKAGEWDKLKGMYTAATPDGQTVIDYGIKRSALGKRVNDACQAKFKMSFKDVLQKAPNANPMMVAQMSQMASGDTADMDVSKVKFAKNDKGVTASLPGTPFPLQLVKEGEAWKFSGTQMDEMAPMVIPMKGMREKLLGSLEQYAGKVEAGEFADAPAAGKAFFDAMMASMGGGG